MRLSTERTNYIYIWSWSPEPEVGGVASARLSFERISNRPQNLIVSNLYRLRSGAPSIANELVIKWSSLFRLEPY